MPLFIQPMRQIKQQFVKINIISTETVYLVKYFAGIY